MLKTKCKGCGNKYKMGVDGAVHGCDKCCGVSRGSKGIIESNPNRPNAIKLKVYPRFWRGLLYEMKIEYPDLAPYLGVYWCGTDYAILVSSEVPDEIYNKVENDVRPKN